MTDTPQAQPTKILVDMGDCLHVLGLYGIVDGIRRVVTETWKELSLHPEFVVVPIAYDQSKSRFFKIDVESVDYLVNKLLSDGDAEVVKNYAKRIETNTVKNKTYSFESNDVMLLLGATWARPAYYSVLADAKSRGLKVVHLMYDLIVVLDDSQIEIREPFETYLYQVANVADRIATISQATRNDFNNFAAQHSITAPPGAVTKLPSGLSEQILSSIPVKSAERSRPYVLMVGTIEERKQHLTALQAWRAMRKVLDDDRMPRLICVGRWGWNVRELVDFWNDNVDLHDWVDFRTDFVPDVELAQLYQDCLFTIYPSRFEGWGLPVTESLAYGKVVITTNTSSLPEAGRNLAICIDPQDSTQLADECLRLINNPEARAKLEENILNNPDPISWKSVAQVLIDETLKASASPAISQPIVIDVNREYDLCYLSHISVGRMAKEYLHAIEVSRQSPITKQISTVSAHARAAMTLHSDNYQIGNQGAYIRDDDEGRKQARLTFCAPKPGRYVLLVAVHSATRNFNVRTKFGAQVDNQIIKRAGVLAVDIDVAEDSRPINVELDFVKGSRTLPWVNIVSYVLLNADDEDSRARISTLRSEAENSGRISLRRINVRAGYNEIEKLKESFSWKVTLPLRTIHRFYKRH